MRFLIAAFLLTACRDRDAKDGIGDSGDDTAAVTPGCPTLTLSLEAVQIWGLLGTTVVSKLGLRNACEGTGDLTITDLSFVSADPRL